MEERSIVIHRPQGTRSVRLVSDRPFQKTIKPAATPAVIIRLRKASHASQGVNFGSLRASFFIIKLLQVHKAGNTHAGMYPDQRAIDRKHALSLIHISEPTRLGMISYAVFCLKKK